MSEGTARRLPRSREVSAHRPSSSPRHGDSAYSMSPSRASVTARLASFVPGTPNGNDARSIRTQRPDKDGNITPLPGATGASLSGPGQSFLSQALKGAAETGDLNDRTLLPRDGAASPDGRASSAMASVDLESRSYRQERSPRGVADIEILKRHLVGPSSVTQESGSYIQQNKAADGPENSATAANESEFSSLQLQGGDTTRHIYRYAEKRDREQAEVQDRETGRLKRSMSMTLPKPDSNATDIQSIQIPGGFRRDHIRRNAPSPAPSSAHHRPQYGTIERAYTEPPRNHPQFVTSNFIEFLTIYGHFAGEEFDEDEDGFDHDEYFSSDAATTEAEEGRADEEWGEDSALLPPNRHKRRRRTRETGNGTPLGAAMLLLKSFVGTGVLFLPRAFYNGGMLFANVILVLIAALSYYCFILLVAVRLKVPASFGDMGDIIFGKHFRNMINFSLVISQVGFTSAYTVFVAENLQAFILAVSKCKTFVDVKWFITMQMIILLPVSLYRKINNIQKLALIADAFICLGLIYLYYYDIKTIVERPGIADIKNFRPDTWTLFIGTAIFTFEGIGLIIPIQNGMREPEKFPRVLAIVMVIMSVLFISIGAISYAAFGSNTKTVIILNLPQDDKLVNAVQFLYSTAILMSIPLQLYPAIEITSMQIFSRTGKHNPLIKWKKNLFRFFMVICCSGIAYFGASDLDKFVSLVGSFACIPLVYIYPPSMHYRVVATRAWQKVVDVLLIVFGFCIMAYATTLTILSWIHGGDIKSPGYCDS